MKALLTLAAAIAALPLSHAPLSAQYYAPATRLPRPSAPDACGPGFAVVNNCGTVFYPSYNLYPCFGPEGNISKDMVRYVAETAPKLSAPKKSKKKDADAEKSQDGPPMQHHVHSPMGYYQPYQYPPQMAPAAPMIPQQAPGYSYPMYNGYPYPSYSPPYSQPYPYSYPSSYSYPSYPQAMPRQTSQAGGLNETIRPAQFSDGGSNGINFSMGSPPAEKSGPVLLPPLPCPEVAANLPQMPELPGSMPTPPSAVPALPGSDGAAPLPSPGYAMATPMLPIPPGYLPPPCCGIPSHPYARSPRDFFMWRENMEDRLQRRRPIPLR